jgi:DNA-binding SARP family transcriptional activator
MTFRLLGAVEVTVDGRPVDLGGRRQRAVLAVLLLHVNEVVSADRLVEEAWDGRPPPGARGTLQTYISRLRRLIGPTPAQIATQVGGYRLAMAPDELDVECFRRLIREGRIALQDRDHGRARELLEDALHLWRGDALADFPCERFAIDFARQLDDERLAAQLGRIEAEVGLGRADSVLVGEVRRLVALRPLDERVRELLMLALYQSGRQAEALEAYKEARHDLVELCGVEPSERLRDLERRILRHDPTLDPPAAQPVVRAVDLLGGPRLPHTGGARPLDAQDPIGESTPTWPGECGRRSARRWACRRPRSAATPQLRLCAPRLTSASCTVRSLETAPRYRRFADANRGQPPASYSREPRRRSQREPTRAARAALPRSVI